MAPVVAYRLCIGDFAVPLVREKREVWDGGDQELLGLSFAKRGGNAQFLEHALGLLSRAFHKTQWPLLTEIMQALMEKRRDLTQSKRASRRPNVVLDLVVRGHRVRVQNSLHAVRLFFEPGSEIEEIEWLLAQFTKDLEDIDEALQTPAKKKGRRETKTSEGLEGKFETPQKRAPEGEGSPQATEPHGEDEEEGV